MKKTLLRCAFVAAVAVSMLLPAGSAAAGELKLSMQNGRVTLVADNVPLRQILQEWARVGQVKIVNADKLAGPGVTNVTLRLTDTPEKDALDVLLRSASGYIAAPRREQLANAAIYDRVTIMPTSRAPAATAANMAPMPTFQRPPQAIDESDEPINVAMPPPPPPNPVVSQYPGMPPQPGLMPPQMQPGAPQAPLTSPRPGAVAPPPTPNAIPNPYQPIRPPGTPPTTTGRGGGPGAS